MKKILIATNLITAALLLFAFTKPDSNKVVEDTGQGPVTNISLGVNMNVAKDIVENYRTKTWDSIEFNNKKYKDARSVWFSLAKLKNFIADIESKVKNTPGKNDKKCNVDDFDLGLRIYFGNYPGTETLWKDTKYGTYFDDHLLPQKYMGLHTVMLVPTLYNANDGFHYDFDPRHIRKSSGRCMGIRIDSVMNILAAANSVVNGQIANNEFYGIMPNNRDNKALFGKIDAFVKSKIDVAFKGMDVPAGSTEANNINIDFTNAGTLVPPPYPEDYGTGTAGRSASTTTSTQVKLNFTYNVPCSGASFMRWVDGLPINCGQYEQQINSTQRAKKTDQIKQQ